MSYCWIKAETQVLLKQVFLYTPTSPAVTAHCLSLYPGAKRLLRLYTWRLVPLAGREEYRLFLLCQPSGRGLSVDAASHCDWTARGQRSHWGLLEPHQSHRGRSVLSVWLLTEGGFCFVQKWSRHQLDLSEFCWWWGKINQSVFLMCLCRAGINSILW